MSLLIKLLAQSDIKANSIQGLSPADWDQVIRQSRAEGLLASLQNKLSINNVLSYVPERPQLHLQSASIVAKQQNKKVNWEVHNIYTILESRGIPVILLKGVAYSVKKLSPSKGRLFGDIDILVPAGAIKDAENILKRKGWLATNHTSYDDKYYRQWMHEIPPLTHHTRQTVLDIHHNILPVTANLKPQASDLWDKAATVEGYNDLYTLSNHDIILHSATHLFQEGEFDRGLRDLYDIAQLIEQFRKEEGFWNSLFERAKTLDLTLPLIYALRYCNQIFGTFIPETSLFLTKKDIPSALKIKLMDTLFISSISPSNNHHFSLLKKTTDWILYIRGHYLKMPVHLLIPHLLYKATLAKTEKEKMAAQQEKDANLLKNFIDN